VATGACTSGGNKDCPGDRSHSLECWGGSAVSNDNDILWKTKKLSSSSSGREDAWLFCESQEAFFARCAGGGEEDCNIANDDYDFAIKCGKMDGDFFLRKEGGISWVCKDHGVYGQCPPYSVAVATCASGRNNDCDWDGCGSKETYTGLKCHQVGVVVDFSWDENDVKTTTEFTTQQSGNPWIGSYSHSFKRGSEKTTKINSVQSTFVEFTTSMEAKLTARYGYPVFNTVSGSIEFGTGLDLKKESKTFKEVNEMKYEEEEESRKIIFDADDIFEGDYPVRVVYYTLTVTKFLEGTLRLNIGGQEKTETVSTKLTDARSGFLALPIGYYSHVCVECGSDRDLVDLYLSGVIFSAENPSLNNRDIVLPQDIFLQPSPESLTIEPTPRPSNKSPEDSSSPGPGPTNELTPEPTPKVCGSNAFAAQADCLDMSMRCPSGNECRFGEACFTVPENVCGLAEDDPKRSTGATASASSAVVATIASFLIMF